MILKIILRIVLFLVFYLLLSIAVLLWTRIIFPKIEPAFRKVESEGYQGVSYLILIGFTVRHLIKCYMELGMIGRSIKCALLFMMIFPSWILLIGYSCLTDWKGVPK